MVNNIGNTLLVINILSILYLVYCKCVNKTSPKVLFLKGLLTIILLSILYLLLMAIIIKPEDAMSLVAALIYQTIYFPFVGLIMFLVSIANNKTWILNNKKTTYRYALLLFIFVILDIYWIIMSLL